MTSIANFPLSFFIFFTFLCLLFQKETLRKKGVRLTSIALWCSQFSTFFLHCLFSLFFAFFKETLERKALDWRISPYDAANFPLSFFIVFFTFLCLFLRNFRKKGVRLTNIALWCSRQLSLEAPLRQLAPSFEAELMHFKWAYIGALVQSDMYIKASTY